MDPQVGEEEYVDVEEGEAPSLQDGEEVAVKRRRRGPCDDICANCSKPFIRLASKRGYDRSSVDRNFKSGGKPFEVLSEEFNVNIPVGEMVFFCNVCYLLLSKVHNYRSQYKKAVQDFLSATTTLSYIQKKRLQTEPATEPVKEPEAKRTRLEERHSGLANLPIVPTSDRWKFTTNCARKDKFSRAEIMRNFETMRRALHSGHPDRLVPTLMRLNKPRQKVITQYASHCEHEMRNYCRLSSDCGLRKELTLENVEQFSCKAIREEAADKMPMLVGALTGAMGKLPDFQVEKLTTSIVAQIAYARNRNVNFFQKLLSVNLWNGKLSAESLKNMNNMHLCLGYNGTKTNVEKLLPKTREEVQMWINSGRTLDEAEAATTAGQLDEDSPDENGENEVEDSVSNLIRCVIQQEQDNDFEPDDQDYQPDDSDYQPSP